MYTETEGIILRSTKTLDGRRILVLLTPKFGKISAGTSISERGKTKTSLAIRPFCLGRYELYKNRSTFNVSGAEVIESNFAIGEDPERYMAAARILELTDSMLGEDQPQPAMFNLLRDYLSLMTGRKTDYDTPGIGFQLKALQLQGCGVDLKNCVRCGAPTKKGDVLLSAEDGGLICSSCAKSSDGLNPLIFTMSDDIISAMEYILSHPLKNLERLSLPRESSAKTAAFLNTYNSYHLGIDRLRSDG